MCWHLIRRDGLTSHTPRTLQDPILVAAACLGALQPSVADAVVRSVCPQHRGFREPTLHAPACAGHGRSAPWPAPVCAPARLARMRCGAPRRRRRHCPAGTPLRASSPAAPPFPRAHSLAGSLSLRACGPRGPPRLLSLAAAASATARCCRGWSSRHHAAHTPTAPVRCRIVW